MKKIAIILLCLLTTVSLSLAYNLNTADQKIVQKSTQSIERTIDRKGEHIRPKVIAALKAYATKYEDKKPRYASIFNAIAKELEKEQTNANTYNIPDTDVSTYYDNDSSISVPSPGEAFYGQDAHYKGNTPSYTDNGDGTITDEVTGLMRQQDMESKMTFEEAQEYAKNLELGGYIDRRIPSIKELYSLIMFNGQVQGQQANTFFIDTDYFTHPLGDTSKGEREIDAQTRSATEYVGRTMNNDETVFGVNFVDGRIKGYPKYDPRTRSDQKMYFRLVRGNTAYGQNNFVDNQDGTITDTATSLMWTQDDSNKGMDREAALAYCENLESAGYTDRKLPNIKELQSIVDYSRSPQTTDSAAIDHLFDTSSITDPNGNKNYPYFWSSTTHLDGKDPENHAAYICFGECQGQMHNKVVDVHGAGAQRSDPKDTKWQSYPQYFGPQGDVRYVENYVRCVREI